MDKDRFSPSQIQAKGLPGAPPCLPYCSSGIQIPRWVQPNNFYGEYFMLKELECDPHAYQYNRRVVSRLLLGLRDHSIQGYYIYKCPSVNPTTGQAELPGFHCLYTWRRNPLPIEG